jgi:flagellar FliL protein
MAEDDDPESEGEEEGGAEEPAQGGGKKKLVLLIGAAVLLILGGLAGAYFTGLMQPLVDMFASKPKEEPEEEEPVLAKETVFYDLPELLVNLNTGDRKATYLKMRVSLELGNAKDIPKIEQFMPRIIDNFQVYLRELRVEDLKGSAGMYRLREELLTLVSAAVAPTRINDVLFKEMLIQ